MNASRPKILIFVGHALYAPWKDILYRGQLDTWAIPGEDSRIIHCFGRPVNNWLHQIDTKYWMARWFAPKLFARSLIASEFVWQRLLNRWHPRVVRTVLPGTLASGWQVQMPDLNIIMTRKPLAIFEELEREEFDFAVFVTGTSYLNIPALESALRKLPREGLTAGRVVEHPNGNFLSGSFRIFTPDVVKLINRNAHRYPHWIPEDAALGRLLRPFNFTEIDLPSIDLPDTQSLEMIHASDLIDIIHFRCKSRGYENRGDVEIMHELHTLLTRARGVE